MKTCRIVVLCLFALLAGIVSSVSAKVRLADPFIFYENGTYYAYGTFSSDGILVFTSKDLKKWTNKGLALNKKTPIYLVSSGLPRFTRLARNILCIFRETSIFMWRNPNRLTVLSNRLALNQCSKRKLLTLRFF